MGNLAFLPHYVRTKVRSGPEIATFRIKTLNFTWVIHWLAKIELRGPGTPGSILLLFVNYCCTRVLLYAKMLKETETEETIGLFVTFLSLVAF